jgi:hypothetical protein
MQQSTQRRRGMDRSGRLFGVLDLIALALDEQNLGWASSYEQSHLEFGLGFAAIAARRGNENVHPKDALEGQ